MIPKNIFCVLGKKKEERRKSMCIRDVSSPWLSQEDGGEDDVSKKPWCRLWLFVGVLGTDALSSTVLLTSMIAS